MKKCVWCVSCIAAAGVSGLARDVRAADAWADGVVSYAQGSDAAAGYTDPLAALGEPARFTGEDFGYPGAVTPFNPPFNLNQIVSIGQGGSLVVRFDEPVRDDAANPYGIDLLVFGNSGYIDGSYPDGLASGVFSDGRGRVEVSADGADWRAVTGAADDVFPTLGYPDLAGPYDTERGSVLSDFTRPVDPAFDASGRTFAEIVAAYAGSGGGTGIDLAGTGFSEVSFVRITNPDGSGRTVEIDGLSDAAVIPGAGAAAVGAMGIAVGLRRRREISRTARQRNRTSGTARARIARVWR